MALSAKPSLLDVDVRACPFAFYSALRNGEPVYYDAATDLWVVSTYELVTQVLDDWQTFSSEIDMRTDVAMTGTDESDRMFADRGYVVRDVLSQVDPPAHSVYRTLVERLFTTPVVKRMEDFLTDHASHLIDGFADKGQCDFFAEYAVPLPLDVIADQLGVPREDAARFKTWSDAIIETLGVVISDQRKLECTRHIIEFQHYFVAVLEAKRATPRDDIISGLVAARKPDGALLTTEELLAVVQQLLVAGNESTRSQLASIALMLARAPELQARLRDNPVAIRNFVDESLRAEGPVQGLFRRAACEVKLGSVTLPKGAKLYVSYASANRDDMMFPDPTTIDPTRANASRHVAFGHGIHRCVGQMLARKELEISVRLLLSQLRNIRLADGYPDITYLPSLIMRCPQALHLRFERA